MRIISKRALRVFWETHPDTKQPLADLPQAIKTDVEHERLLAEVDRLMSKGDTLSPEQGALLDLMMVLIEAYEEKHTPMPLSSPHTKVRTLMEERGLRQDDLVPVLGSIGIYTNRRLSLRRSAMFIAGGVKTVFSSSGATSVLGPHAAPTELTGLSCAIIYKHPAPTELKTCVDTNGSVPRAVSPSFSAASVRPARPKPRHWRSSSASPSNGSFRRAPNEFTDVAPPSWRQARGEAGATSIHALGNRSKTKRPRRRAEVRLVASIIALVLSG